MIPSLTRPLLSTHAGRLPDRDQLESEANVARERLARTLEVLDRRRHEAVDIRLQLRRHRRGLVIAGGVTIVTAGGVTVTAVLLRRARARAEAKPRSLVEMLRRVWRGPERVARTEPRGFLRELGRKLALGTLSWIALELAKAAGRPAAPRLEPAAPAARGALLP